MQNGNSRAGFREPRRQHTANAVKRRTLSGLADKPTHYGVDINDPWRERHNAQDKVITRRKGSEHNEYN